MLVNQLIIISEGVLRKEMYECINSNMLTLRESTFAVLIMGAQSTRATWSETQEEDAPTMHDVVTVSKTNSKYIRIKNIYYCIVPLKGEPGGRDGGRCVWEAFCLKIGLSLKNNI